MSTEITGQKKVQTEIRTYAQDLEAARQRRDGDKGEGGAGKTVPAPATPEQKARPQVAITAVDTDEVQMAQAPTDIERPAHLSDAEIEAVAVEGAGQVPPAADTQPEPKPTPKKIPAYHEIQQQASKLAKAQEAGDRVNIGFDATVIRDTKTHRFSLFSSIGQSLSNWVAGLKKSFRKKTPTYVVSDSSHRKGVIQKATSKTGAAFSADNEKLREKIRLRQQLEEEAQKEAETVWTPYTETGYELLEEPDEKRVDTTSNVQIEPKRSIFTVPPPQPVVVDEPEPEPAVEEESAAAPEPEPEPEPEPTKEENTIDSMVEDTRWEDAAKPAATPELAPEPVVEEGSAPEPEPEPLAEELTPESEAEPIPDSEGAEPVEIRQVPVESVQFTDGDLIPDEKPKEEKEFSIRDTNTLTLILVGIVVLSISLVLSIRLVLGTFAPNEPVPRNIPADVSLQGSQSTEVVYDGTRNLFTVMNETVAAQPLGLIDIQIIDSNAVVIPPEAIFNTLQFDMLTSFRQSVTDVRFATINQSKPILIFSFTDAMTVRGGFLEWEKTMASDVAPLYTTSVETSRSFTDEVIRGKDTRIMRTNDGEVILLYSIVDENTALIANDTEAFTQVLETSFSE